MPIASQMADAYPRRTRVVSRLPANVRLWLLELSGWRTSATPIGRNRGKRGCQTDRLNQKYTVISAAWNGRDPTLRRNENEPQARIRGASASTDLCWDRARKAEALGVHVRAGRLRSRQSAAAARGSGRRGVLIIDGHAEVILETPSGPLI